MKKFTLYSIAFTVLASAPSLVSTAAAAETGELKVKFKFGGDPPTAAPVKATANAEFCGKHGLTESGLIVSKEGYIANVMLYVYTGRGGSDIEYEGGEAKVVELANINCEFEPHVVVAMTGDTLKVTNPDPIGHNANMQFLMNNPQNPMIPAGQNVTVELKDAEPAPIPVTCNVHPWMKARLLVLDHPYAGVSDENGELTIKGLPAGEELVFRISHESASFKEVEMGGKTEKLRRSNIEVEIEPGLNDLGTIIIDADQFD